MYRDILKENWMGKDKDIVSGKYGYGNTQQRCRGESMCS